MFSLIYKRIRLGFFCLLIPVFGLSLMNAKLQNPETKPAQQSVAASAVVEGKWDGKLKGSEFCVEFRSAPTKNSNWQMQECFSSEEFARLPSGNNQKLRIPREAGTMELEGDFNSRGGKGTFVFLPDADFRKFLNQETTGEVEDKQIVFLYMARVGREYMNYLGRNGYDQPAMDEVVGLTIHGLDYNYLQDFLPAVKAYGINKIPLKGLVRMKIHNVSSDYIQSLADLRVTGLDVDQLVRARIHNVEPDYIQAIYDSGLKDVNFEDLVRFSIHHVDPDLVTRLAGAGIKGMNADQVVNASIHHVNMDLIDAVQSVGLTNLSMEDITKMSIHHTDPELLRTLKELGYEEISADLLIRATIHNVDLEMIRGLDELGYKQVPLDELVALSIHHVTPAFIRRANEKGYKNLSLDEYKRLKIHNMVN